MSKTVKKSERTGLEIAVIGMAGRFPGAGNIHEFRQNLKNGVESITFFSHAELEQAGIDPALIKNENYVKAKGILDRVDYFDAFFFDYSPREAQGMDPQMRILFECAWESLEDAGYDPSSYKGAIGLYAGSSSGMMWGLQALSGAADPSQLYGTALLTDRDFLCTQISYKLNLKGPAITVQTACSTSLVAIHMGCQSLLSGECHIALAGGVSVSVPSKTGYLYQEGMIGSSDGHCRAFDEKADGTLAGEGAGIVVLKLLDGALRDGDHIYAVVKGSAINNDGKRKVGYTAPSVKGQAGVIRAAYRAAGVSPETVGYIEAHGTGTSLGDPIEIEALKLAFNTGKKRSCRIGSVKANIGHLDSAAGAAGFIKTVLALKYRFLPPAVNFTSPNPHFDLKNSPFYIDTRPSQWESNGRPLRAGVSSFGIGGTNAHAILEEAPEIPEIPPGPGKNGRRYRLILLSAKTAAALEGQTENFAEFLKTNRNVNLADAAYTLQVGRHASRHRKMLVCAGTGVDEAIGILSGPRSVHARKGAEEEKDTRVVFMFPGQGAQYVEMGLDLYREEPRFREEMDRCFEILTPIMGAPVKDILFPAAAGPKNINDTEIAQPVIFAIEYALAKLLMKWGIKPYAMLGHSIGEYTAACLSGVFSLEDALKIVCLRGKLMQRMPPGAMLGVSLTEEKLKPLLPLPAALSLAAVNSSSRCVVSGPTPEVEAFEKELTEKGHRCRRLHTSHAFHSRMMAPMVEPFEQALHEITLHQPAVPYISNITGNWITAGEATSPGYWGRHLLQTVRFGDGVTTSIRESPFPLVFLEVGPGNVLSTFVRAYDGESERGYHSVNLLRHPRETGTDDKYLLSKIGELWLHGISPDWKAFYAGEKRRRIPLPTYPFERRRYRADGNIEDIMSRFINRQNQNRKKPDMADWFYVPVWEQSPVPAPGAGESPAPSTPSTPCTWMLFKDTLGLGDAILKQLEREGREVMVVNAGASFKKTLNKTGRYEFTVNPADNNDYNRLFKEIAESGKIPVKILHLWGVTGHSPGENELEAVESSRDTGLYSLLNTVQAIGKNSITDSIQLEVVTDRMQEVDGEENLCPGKATLLGAVKVIPLEYPNIHCRSIDILPAGPGSPMESKPVNKLVKQLIAEFQYPCKEIVLAIRGSYRWVQSYKPVRLGPPGEPPHPLKQRGVYLITGGLGGMGFTLAESLGRRLKARLILTDIEDFPSKEEWDDRLADFDAGDDAGDDTARKIQTLRELEDQGAEVHVHRADVSDLEQMKEAISKSEGRFGEINGVIHTAGLIDYAGVIQKRTREKTEELLKAKVKGTLVLDRILKNRKLDFIALFSSIGNILYKVKFGQVGYNAGHEFLDVFAFHKQKEDIPTVTIDWDDWRDVGMASRVSFESGMSPSEGVEVFYRVLASNLPRAAVSPHDLNRLIEHINHTSSMGFESSATSAARESGGAFSERPELSTQYVAPKNRTEKILADIWEKFFGFARVGIRDDFFELGGDSLKAMSLLSIIHKEVDVEVPLAEIFNRPVIETLAEFINSAGKTTHTSIEPVEEKEYYELSSAQKRLFFLDQLEGIGTSYNMPFALNCKGYLDKHRLDYAVNALLERHTVLRTSFLTIDDLPFQRIHPHVEFRLQEIGAAKKDIREIIDQFIQPFDLSRAPLWRVALHTISDHENLLLFDVHHIIGDGTTISILVEEFARLYAGEALPPLKIQYKDFSARQNHESESRRLKKHEDYWLNRCSGEIPRLNLPTDYPRPPVFNFEGEVYEYALEIGDMEGYRETTSRGGATLYMNMLTFFMVLLYKYTGREDIIVGTGIAGRPHDDWQNVGGLFVNLLPIRANPHGTKSFPEFLTEIKDISLQAFENQEVQFEDLVNKLNLDRDISGNPLFDVSFGVQNFRRSKFKVKEITFTPYEFEMKTSKFDISFLVHEEKDKLFFRFEYCTRLFKGETIRRMANHLITIISQVKQHPGIRLSDIDILTHREKRLLLVDFNKTTADFPFHKSIHGLFEDRVAKTPGLTAVEDETGCFTYRQLDRAANQLAHDLISRGHIRPGHDHCVGILMENCRSLATALWGSLKAGAAYVPISPGWPEERTRRVIADAGIRVVISRGDQPDMDISIARDGGLPETFKYPPDSDGPDNYPHPPDIPGSASHNLAYVIYTSGTTGIPNGILVRHDSVVNYTSWKINLCGFTSSDVILQLVSPSFDGFGSNFFPTLLTGGKLVMVETQKSLDSHYIGGLIKDKKITGFSAAPPIYRTLLEGAEEYQLRGLRFVVLGGEKPGDDLIGQSSRLIPRLTLINEYGPTEATIAAAAHVGMAPGEASIIGKPIDNTSIFLLDKNKKPVPIGVTGELYISGKGLARGYLNRPELTAEKFVRGAAPPLITPYPLPLTPLYRTGDLARWLPEGNIEFLGRIDHQVKLRGYRIELSEIENRLFEYDKITDAVIVAGKAAGTNDNGNDIRYLAAYYVSRQEISPDVSEIKEFLSKRLPGYMVPSYFIQLEKLPLTPQGKVDRKSLPSPLTAAAGQEYIPAGSEIEKDLVKMWAEVLEIEEGKVGINDNFFDLGGHSLKATGLVSRIRKEMDIRFPLNMVFKEPTIKGFAGYISRARRAIYEEITPVEKREYYLQSYAQKRIFLLERSGNTGTAYNNVTVLRIEGELDKKGMANAFKRLLHRHEALRTSFDLIDGCPVQKVLGAQSIEFEIEYLEWERPAGVDAAVRDFIRPFDLSCSPLLRVGLIQIDPKTHILAVDMHQITSDGVSKGILVREFAALYAGEELPPLGLQYKDFTLWQNHLLQTGGIKEQEDFWLGLYPSVDNIPRLPLPADYPRPPKKTFEGATYRFKLGVEESLRFKEMGRTKGITLFMNLLAALNVLLYRYTGMSDIILGCGIMGRPNEELENIIGLFVNLLPLRNTFDPETTYDEFLGKIKETCIRAFECQDVQLEALVEKLKLEREPSRDNPFFDMAFLLQNFDRSVVHLEDVSFSLCDNKHPISKFDITLFTFEVGDEIHFTAEYSTRLFKRETIERMTSHYIEIIRQAVRDGRLKLKDFELPGDPIR